MCSTARTRFSSKRLRPVAPATSRGSPRSSRPIQPDREAADAAGTVPSVTDVETRASRILRDLYAPPGVIVDDQMQVLSFHGETGFYLEHTPEAVRSHLLQLAREGLVYPLRRLVGSAIQRNEPMSEAHVRAEYGSQVREISIHVIPIATAPVRCFAVLFAPEVPSSQAQTPAAPADAGTAHRRARIPTGASAAGALRSQIVSAEGGGAARGGERGAQICQ